MTPSDSDIIRQGDHTLASSDTIRQCYYQARRSHIGLKWHHQTVILSGKEISHTDLKWHHPDAPSVWHTHRHSSAPCGHSPYHVTESQQYVGRHVGRAALHVATHRIMLLSPISMLAVMLAELCSMWPLTVSCYWELCPCGHQYVGCHVGRAVLQVVTHRIMLLSPISMLAVMLAELRSMWPLTVSCYWVPAVCWPSCWQSCAPCGHSPYHVTESQQYVGCHVGRAVLQVVPLTVSCYWVPVCWQCYWVLAVSVLHVAMLSPISMLAVMLAELCSMWPLTVSCYWVPAVCWLSCWLTVSCYWVPSVCWLMLACPCGHSPYHVTESHQYVGRHVGRAVLHVATHRIMLLSPISMLAVMLAELCSMWSLTVSCYWAHQYVGRHVGRAVLHVAIHRIMLLSPISMLAVMLAELCSMWSLTVSCYWVPSVCWLSCWQSCAPSCPYSHCPREHCPSAQDHRSAHQDRLPLAPDPYGPQHWRDRCRQWTVHHQHWTYDLQEESAHPGQQGSDHACWGAQGASWMGGAFCNGIQWKTLTTPFLIIYNSTVNVHPETHKFAVVE